MELQLILDLALSVHQKLLTLQKLAVAKIFFLLLKISKIQSKMTYFLKLVFHGALVIFFIYPVAI